jgi:hypothetical protein
MSGTTVLRTSRCGVGNPTNEGSRAAGEGPTLERDPAQYAGIFERLDKVHSPLNRTGFVARVADAETVAPEIQVDADEYGMVLEAAAERWLRVQQDAFREIDLAAAERTSRGEPPIREAVIARLNALQGFLATVRSGDLSAPG